MTSSELRKIIEEIAAKHLDTFTVEGLFPDFTDQDIQSNFEAIIDGIYQIIFKDPYYRDNISTAKKEEVEDYLQKVFAELEMTARVKQQI